MSCPATTSPPPWTRSSARPELAGHAAPRLVLDRRFTLETEVVNLQAWAALVAGLAGGRPCRRPDLPGPARLGARRSAQPPRSTRTSHRHVLVDQRLEVIDFDEVRLGDPAYDVAHFCPHLRAVPGSPATGLLRGPRSRVHGHLRRAGRCPNEAPFSWFAAYTCLKIAKQLCDAGGPAPPRRRRAAPPGRRDARPRAGLPWRRRLSRGRPTSPTWSGAGRG